MKILLVEDDNRIVSSLYSLLHSEYKIVISRTGRDAWQKLRLSHFELILLDLNLPDISGRQICQKLRETGVTTPVLVLSGISDYQSRADLLDIGANDYLTKPYSGIELAARVRALLRTHRKRQITSKIHLERLEIDTTTRQVFRDGLPIMLRRKEYDLLECLAINAGQVVHHEILSAYVWDSEVEPSTLQVQIKNLRQKIDKPFADPIIRTIHGIGYCLNQPIKSSKV